jgi:hypothetical protein
VRRLIPALLAVWAAVPAGAQPAPAGRPLLWSVEDADSRVYLLGAVHLLPTGTDVLPGAAAGAYADAEVVAFEVDLGGAAAAAATAALRALATDGVALSKRLGPADAGRLDRLLQRTGLALAAVEGYDPWFVALLLAQVPDGSPRFSAEAGVDSQLYARAQADGKERLGLETVDDQVDALDGLPLKDQLAFLRDAIGDGGEGGGLAALVAAWEAGDAEALAARVEEGVGATPSLRQRLFTDRNARWTPQIEALLGRVDQDALVVVGAGHLVGPDSVVEMLTARGYTVTRL